MTWVQLLRLWPLLKLFAPTPLRQALEFAQAGLEREAAKALAEAAHSQATGQAAGRAAAASSRATEQRH